MKTKLLSILTAFLLFSTTVTAQENSKKDFKRHEVSLGYGIIPISEFGSFLGALIITPAEVFAGNGIRSIKSTGAINMDYSYHFTKMVAISGNVSYSQSKCSIYNKTTDAFIKDVKINFFTALVGAKFDWINLEHFALYSRFSAGVTVVDDIACFMIHGSPVGLEGGASFLRAYLELGFGQNGIISFGIRGRF